MRWQLVVMLEHFEWETGPQRWAATIQAALLETAANAMWCAESGRARCEMETWTSG